jgi:hypothetical protein
VGQRTVARRVAGLTVGPAFGYVPGDPDSGVALHATR